MEGDEGGGERGGGGGGRGEEERLDRSRSVDKQDECIVGCGRR